MLCEHLDDYVCRSLPPGDMFGFEQHLEHCSSCREAVTRESALFDTIARAVEALEPAPANLAVYRGGARASASVPVGAGRVATVLCLAALIAVVGFFAFSGKIQAIRNDRIDVVDQAKPVRPPKIDLPEDVQGITIASTDPNIQIILLSAPKPDPKLLVP